VRMGFVETEARHFDHLPVVVQYLEYVLPSARQEAAQRHAVEPNATPVPPN
jgi:hypothetical protein